LADFGFLGLKYGAFAGRTADFSDPLDGLLWFCGHIAKLSL
jgi:hypothetical protein